MFCTIREIGETGDGQLFIAMPLYAGESLKANRFGVLRSQWRIRARADILRHGLERDGLVQPSEGVRRGNECLVTAAQKELAVPPVCKRQQIAFAGV